MDEELWKAATEDVQEGKMVGPFASEEEVRAWFGGGRIAVSRRSGVQQSEKVRPVDNFTKKGKHVNGGFRSRRKLRLPGLDIVCAMAFLLFSACFGALAFWKQDHKRS